MALQPGDSFVLPRTFRQADFDRFAALSGDNNPIHVDPEFSARTKFGATVSHGMLLYTCVCGALETWLAGAVQLEQRLMFPAPTYTGKVFDIVLTCLEVDETAGTALIETVTANMDGTHGLEGQTFVRLPGADPFPVAYEPDSRESEDAALRSMALGQSAMLTRAFSAADLAEYASLAGIETPPGTVPGPLLGGLFSTLLGTTLPGPGSNYLKQSLVFTAEVLLDQMIDAEVRIHRIRATKQIVNLDTTCTVGEKTVCSGDALIMVSDVV